MPDPNRVYGGFSSLLGGMDADQDASLLAPDQCALAGNLTMRGSFAKVRSPYSNLILTFPDEATQSAWNGRYQGACFYSSEQEGGSGFVVSISGRVYFVPLGKVCEVEDITPAVLMVTTSSFIVPNPSELVWVNVNIVGVKSADVVHIGNGEYLVSQVASDSIELEYVGGAADMVPTGATIYNYLNNQTGVQTANDFTPPTIGTTVPIDVSSATPFALQDIYLLGGQYQIQKDGINGNILTIKYIGGGPGGVYPSGTPLYDYASVLLATETVADFTEPSPGDTIQIEITNSTAIGLFQIIIAGGTYIIEAISGMTLTGRFYGVIEMAGENVEDASFQNIYVTHFNPANLNFVDVFQAENFAILLAGQNSTLIFDGSQVSVAKPDQLPPALLGTYAWGRIWLVLNDRKSFVASDLVGDPSGTAANLYVDAILYMTENALINGGGAFKVPNDKGLITSIGTFPMLDTSIGIGPVMVGTTNSIISVNAPVDRTIWQNLSYPIATIAALDYGPLAQRAVTAVNSDLWFRSIDGIRSFKACRQDFIAWLNVAQSQEISPILNEDSNELLGHACSVLFGNRLLGTVSPYPTASGIAHRGLSVICFDSVTNLRRKSLPNWEGLYTGLQILQLVKGVVAGVERAFMFVLNGTAIEIWEIETTGKYDRVTTLADGVQTITYVPIESFMVSRRDGFSSPEQLKSLYTAELYLDEISDDVSITVKWRPDQHPDWTTWATFNFCATEKQCTLAPPTTPGQCHIWREDSPQYAARLMLPLPPEVINTLTNGYMALGYEFQFRFEITGHVKFRKFKAHAKIKDDNMEGSCPPAPTCSALPVCELPIFDYDAHNG